MSFFCKYCGKEIAEDSIYCSWCGKNITKTIDPIQKIKVEDSVQVILKEKDKQQWQSAENLQWSKPYVIRTIQVLLLLFSITSMIYGVVWFIIGGKTDNYIPHPSYNYDKNRFELFLYRSDPLHLSEIYFNLNDFKNGKYFNEWQETLKCYDDHRLDYYHLPCPGLSGYWDIAKQNSMVLFRIKIALIIIIPTLILGIIIVLWMRKTRFPNSKDKLPRDFADKIEVYSWSGFRVPKYVFFQKDNKYGVIDASKYIVVIPAQYDAVIWREQNVSFDATLNNKEETIIINHQLEKQ